MEILVLGDSLLKYIPCYLDCKKFKVDCFPGINVNRLIGLTNDLLMHYIFFFILMLLYK